MPGGLRLSLAPWRGLGGVPGGGQPQPFQRRWAQRRAERGLADSWLISDAPSCDARSRASSSRPGSSTTKLRLTGWGTHAVPGTARHLKCTGGHPASTAPACCPPPGGLLLTRGQQKGAEKPREALGCPGRTRRWLRLHQFYPILAATTAKRPAEPWDRPQHPGLGGNAAVWAPSREHGGFRVRRPPPKKIPRLSQSPCAGSKPGGPQGAAAGGLGTQQAHSRQTRNGEG